MLDDIGRPLYREIFNKEPILHDNILLLGISGRPSVFSSNKYLSWGVGSFDELFIELVFSPFDEDLISSSSSFSTSSISISSSVNSFFSFDFSWLWLTLDEFFISSSSIKFHK